MTSSAVVDLVVLLEVVDMIEIEVVAKHPDSDSSAQKICL
jgi:hypothetical protein